MKRNADKKQREVVFEVGEWVYLKLQPYRQLSIVRQNFHKLAAKFFGPFEIVERIGAVAFCLKLPKNSKIHDVFHVSQLKAAVGEHHQVQYSAPPKDMEEELWFSESILEVRFNNTGGHEFLVKWQDRDVAENSWISSKEFVQLFPNCKLEDKLVLGNGSIDTIQQTYFRKKKKISRQTEVNEENTTSGVKND